MGDSYSQAKAFLEQGRPVLFSGTPCQIAGFNRFLGKEYPHLVTCDFICTGVPNPKAFRAYREHYAKRWKEPITGIAFRDKQYGWDSFSMVIRGKTKQYRKVRFFDPFIQAFYSHLLLRPACYHCQFKKYNSGSDIKLADYWYVKRVHPEIYHRDGVSLVMMGTAKGQALFDSVAPEMEKVESSMKNVFQTNASFETIVKEPPSRKEYLHTICHTDSTEDIVHCIKKLAKQPLKNQLVAKLRFYKQQLFARK
nr:Coenzyme F420 hydrogenase/dehydrogenase, beta subunit C-terminal domain [Neobittarella massiliensis]